MANAALMALSALQQQAQQGEEAAQPLPLIQQAAQANVAPERVARPGDVQAAGGLLTGINARKRIKEQTEIDNRFAQAKAEIDFARQQVADRRDLVDLGIAEQNLRQARIQTDVDELNFERAQGMGIDPDKLISVANQLRDERNADLAPFVSNLAAFDELSSIQSLSSGPASFATLFKFIKSMDDSVVRSSEGELLTSSTGVVRTFANQYNAAVGRGFFDETTTAEIMQTAQTMAESNFRTAQEINDRHDKLVGQFATQFMEPGLVELTQSARFKQDRTFDPLGEVSRGTPGPGEEVINSVTDAIPGFKPL